MDDRENISANTPLSNDEWLKYVDDELTQWERLALEKKMQDPFEVDAIEGLKQVQDVEKVEKYVGQLNVRLRQIIKRPRKPIESIPFFYWTIFTILTLLFICVVSFILISLNSKGYWDRHFPFK